jgi:hypothetical protein
MMAAKQPAFTGFANVIRRLAALTGPDAFVTSDGAVDPIAMPEY